MSKIKLATVFSGIGAIEQAFLKQNINYEIVFACDTGERYIDDNVDKIRNNILNLSDDDKKKYISNLYDKTKKHNYVKDSYFANYDITEDKWFDDIRFLDGTKYKNKVDLFVGGSPCQSFSIIGKRAGLDDARGTLFYDYARLVKEIQPKAFIFENVPGMLTHDHGNTWKVIYEVFESLGYNLHHKILNAKNYGIPQDRKRLFLVGFKNNVKFEFPKEVKLNTTMFNYLQTDPVETRHYLGKKGFEFVTNPKYKNRARVNADIIQTQKANQQFNWNGDFVFVPYDKIKDSKPILNRAFIGVWNNQRGAIRQLTYRECLRLMGFSENYKLVVPNIPAYRQFGNSIVVNVLEALLKEILKVI